MKYRASPGRYRRPPKSQRYVPSKHAGTSQALVGQADAVSTTTGALAVSHTLVGSSAAVSATTGDLTTDTLLDGTSTAVSSTSGALTVAHALVGQSDGVASTTGNLSGTRPMSATSAAHSTTTGALSVLAGSPFVASVSANGHYLLDQNGDAYLTVGNSPQNGVANWTLANWDSFFSSQQSKGFNSSQVHLVYNYQADAQSSTNPFGDNATFGSPASAYWATVDSIFDLAAEYGFTLWATVIDNISCGTTVAAATDANCFAYGQFLGARYKTRQNLVWVVGNDFDSTQYAARNPKYKKILDGIVDQGDTHLVTVWNNTVAGNNNTGMDGYQTVDNGYAYDTAPYNQSLVSYDLTRTGYPQPFVWFEGTYWGEHNAGAGSSTNLELRKLAWWTLTAGGVGVFLGTNKTWGGTFSQWTTESTGLVIYDQYALIGQFVTGFSGWESLVPDEANAFQTGGLGTDGSLDASTLATAAYIPNGHLGLVYFPTSRGSITFDTTQLSGTVTAYWWDPTDGSTTSEANPAAPTHPGNNSGGDGDWILVFQADGQVTLAGTTAATSATTGDLTAAHSLVGTSAGVAATTGAIVVARALVATSAAQSGTSATLTGGGTNVPFGTLLGSPEFYNYDPSARSWNDASYDFWASQ